MFRRLATDAQPDIEITVDGVPLPARRGDTVAAAMFAGGVTAFRDHPVDGTPRAPLCMMGVCFECLVTIDDQIDRQACMILVADGMRVQRQHGRPALPGTRGTI